MLRRRDFLLAPIPLSCARSAPAAAPPPIAEPHFPSRLYQFVWRNWELANTSRMAQVVGARDADILELGNSMGLPEKRTLSPDQLRRIYITAIRQNWHLLPENQIIALLGWERKKFEFTLKEDDFLAAKLGAKPDYPELRYQPPSERERAGAARIRQILRDVFGPALYDRGEDRFAFVQHLSASSRRLLRDRSLHPSPGEIDLSRDWRIVARDTALAPAAARFRAYLETVMAARLDAHAGRSILLTTDPERAPDPESFAIEAGEKEVRITGHDRNGVLQALYWLQDAFERRGAPFLATGAVHRRCVWNPRYLYSYFALYGDPLLETDIDPLPEHYLEKLARTGMNGVWMQAVLHTLAPSPHFPEFGASSDIRLATLNKLVRRAQAYGMKIYLYINEPRAMPEAFFRKYPEIRGSFSQGLYAMCTSAPVVREWLSASLAHVFEQVPDLGGIFSITMSENLTNCFSHGGGWGTKAPAANGCPRCSRRQSWDVIGEVLRTFRDGIRRSSQTAAVIAWDWGWPSELSHRLIPALPKDVRLLSVSEWYQPVHRGGVDTRVAEYSISVAGPGPRAQENWGLARASGIAAMAKLQFNNTWEISAVPYIPVPNLVLEHCANLARAGISGIQASWTCGGYPSPNLAAAKAYDFEPRPSNEEILHQVAAQLYGSAAAASAVAAWKKFSAAFQEYPYGVHMYLIPTQHGPANLLRLHPTGNRPAMILFPHDSVKAWSGAYPPEVVHRQFAKMAAMWKEGLEAWKADTGLGLAVAQTCYNHFQSVANQVEFYILRDGLPQADPSARKTALQRMRRIAEQEIELARAQYTVARRNSVIAYEASNHYYYTPLDLAEKVLNCREIISAIEA